MSEREKLIDEIKALFSEKLLLQVESADADLVEAGTLDSLTLVELLLHLEHQYGFSMSIENLDIENFRCIDKIAELVSSHKDAVLRPVGLTSTTAWGFPSGQEE